MNDWMLVLFRDDQGQEEQEKKGGTYSLRNVEPLELDKFDKGNIDSDHHSSPEF